MTIGIIEGPDYTDASKLDEEYFARLLKLSPNWEEVFSVIDSFSDDTIVLRVVSKLRRTFGIDSESVGLRLYELAMRKRTSTTG